MTINNSEKMTIVARGVHVENYMLTGRNGKVLENETTQRIVEALKSGTEEEIVKHIVM